MTDKADRNVALEPASSNRSACQVCKEKIEKGAMRVGHPSQSNGMSIKKWVKPECYLRTNVIFEYSSNKSTCCLSRREIPKHTLRLTMALLKCDGKYGDKKFFHPPEARALVQEMLALDECSGHSVASLCASLTDDVARAWAVDALSGCDVSGRPVPMQEPEPKPRAPKRKKAAAEGEEAPTTSAKKGLKKRAKVEDADGDEHNSDGELCD